MMLTLIKRMKHQLLTNSTMKMISTTIHIVIVHVSIVSTTTTTSNAADDEDGRDVQVCALDETAWKIGEAHALCANLASGIRHFDENLKEHLFVARKLFTASNTRVWTPRLFPITPSTTQDKAAVAFSHGWILKPVAPLACCDGLLRTVELLSLQISDMSGWGDDVSLVITLRETMTSDRKSISERAIIEDPDGTLQYDSAEQRTNNGTLEMPKVVTLKKESVVLLTMLLTLLLTGCFDIVADSGF